MQIRTLLLTLSICSLSQSTALASPKLDQMTEQDAYKLVIVMEQIKQLYVKDMTYNEITNNAVKGMLSNMDPYSQVLDTKKLEQLNNSTRGEFGGVGIEITMDEGEVKVIAPIDGSPAAKAGIKSGDFITHVNGTRIHNIDLTDVVDMITGEPGTDVRLAVVSPAEKDLREVTVKRKKISHSSVKSELIGDILYGKIASFADRTHTDFLKAVTENSNKISGVIVDVRNNPGGLLESAVKMTDMFLDSG